MLLHFKDDSLKILRKSVLAVAPQEGCALLLGNIEKVNCSLNENKWIIQKIWPCCNIWEPEIFPLNETSIKRNEEHSKRISRKNRFHIDPREQIQAQKWARGNGLIVLGSAHSHPSGDAVPSAIDCRWPVAYELMVIIDKFGRARAWLMSHDQNEPPVELHYSDHV